MKNLITLTLTILLFSSCEKELSINDFSDDFSFYEPELRIEAIIYPTDNTALVRIDQSVRIDEADLYDCVDDDLDWNYYNCSDDLLSYESHSECIENCNSEVCNLHLYACENYEDESDSLLTFINKSECDANCPWECVTDDTGTDGVLTPTDGHGFGVIQPDEDGSENNGEPDCNEPNIDEYNEILPNIHVEDCEVLIQNLDDECNMIFSENAGEIFEFSGKRDHNGFEIVNYGGFVPDSSCTEFFFQNYDTEYELNINCPEDSTFSRYGIITATDIIKKSPVAFHPDNIDEIINCSDSEHVHDCLINNKLETLKDDNNSLINNLIFLTKYFPDYIDTVTNDTILLHELVKLTDYIPPVLIDSIGNNIIDSIAIELNDTLSHTEIISYLHNNALIDTNLLFIGSTEESKIFYVSLIETGKFQTVQYYYDEFSHNFIYIHGHPDGFTDSSELPIEENIGILTEHVVAEQIDDSYKYKYVFYAFSQGYENYYFYDLLDILDPVRTNIRDKDGNPVMGGFGSMASETVYFNILNPEDILNFQFPQP